MKPVARVRGRFPGRAPARGDLPGLDCGARATDAAAERDGGQYPPAGTASFDVSVVIPTLREAPNVAALAPRIAGVMAPTGLSFELVVVDDDSRDGIDAVCRELARTMPLRLLVRRQRGLATAVLAGIEASRGRYLVVMDADQSHPPDAIPRLLAPLIEDRADFVVGSRYVAGSSIDVEWTLRRRITSRVASLLVAPLTTLADPLAGFFALRRADVPDPATLSPLGYKVGLEIQVRGNFSRVLEVPIHFAERAHGESKLDLHESVLFVAHVARLLRYRYLGR